MYDLVLVYDVVVYWRILSCLVLCGRILCRLVSYYRGLYCVVVCCDGLAWGVLYWIAMPSNMLYWIVLSRLVLSWLVLYWIVLDCL